MSFVNEFDSLPLAALLMERLLITAPPSRVVFSAFGLREGCLFDRLPDSARDAHPLLAAASDLARVGRFPENREALFAFMTPILALIPTEHAALAVDRQEDDPGSQLAMTRRLLALRRERPALRLGSMTVKAAEGSILAFERMHGNASLLCVFNLGAEPTTWSPADADAWTEIEAVNGAALGVLPAYGVLIAERRA